MHISDKVELIKTFIKEYFSKSKEHCSLFSALSYLGKIDLKERKTKTKTKQKQQNKTKKPLCAMSVLDYG